VCPFVATGHKKYRKKRRTVLNFQILKGMHFIHVNARSILPKMSELRIMAKESKAAVIAISETWLDSSVINSEIQIEGYSIQRRYIVPMTIGFVLGSSSSIQSDSTPSVCKSVLVLNAILLII
jgi:hypothetical protein